MKKIIAVLGVSLCVAGCASIQSVETNKGETGLKYFMPKKDIQIGVTVDSNSKISKVAIGTTVAYPDLDRTYVLKYGRNLVGKNTLDVAIGDKGLLTSAKSTTVSTLTEALKNAAMSVAAARLPNADAPNPTCGPGEYTFIYPVDATSKTPCGITITIDPVGSSKSGGHGIPRESQTAGVFYRQNEPYRVTAMGGGQNLSAIIFSPSKAPVEFLPITRSLFTGSEATLAFEDGAPKSYKQESDGELVALFKLPADVLTAYFAALGSTLDSFKSTDEKKAAAITADVKLDLARRKYDACIKAIQANDTALIKQLEC